MFHLTALVTCLVALAYFLISFRVGKARQTRVRRDVVFQYCTF